MLLQRHPQNKSIRAVVKDSNGRVHQRGIKRSWNPTINFIATEDHEGFGIPLKACIPYSCGQQDATVILWNFSAMSLSYAELWYCTDRKSKPFRYDSFEGHLLASLHGSHMKHEAGRQVGTPFLSSIPIRELLNIFDRQMLAVIGDRSDENQLEAFYGVGYNCINALFKLSDHKRVRVKDGNLLFADNTLSNIDKNDSVDVIICLSGECPSDGCVQVDTADGGTVVYEAGSVVCTRRTADGDRHPGWYECERYGRNRKGFHSWWMQDRKAKINKS